MAKSENLDKIHNDGRTEAVRISTLLQITLWSDQNWMKTKSDTWMDTREVQTTRNTSKQLIIHMNTTNSSSLNGTLPNKSQKTIWGTQAIPVSAPHEIKFLYNLRVTLIDNLLHLHVKFIHKYNKYSNLFWISRKYHNKLIGSQSFKTHFISLRLKTCTV